VTFTVRNASLLGISKQSQCGLNELFVVPVMIEQSFFRTCDDRRGWAEGRTCVDRSSILSYL